jgi:uncharacterized protein YbbK (DUF523 family)
MEKILVSACTVGWDTKFNGSSISLPKLVQLVEKGIAISYCAEVHGAGFPVPRKPAEIETGKTAADVLRGKARIYEIRNEDGSLGKDVTDQFMIGAMNTLKICLEKKIKVAILRENSPSCGSSLVFDGNFKGEKIPGMGIVAQLLRNNGIIVYSQENVPEDFISNLLNES